MRIIFLVALCLAVASATSRYSNRNQFQRLLRALQRQQQEQGQEQCYGRRCQSNLFNEVDEQDDDEDWLEQGQRRQYGQQCSRNQRYGSLNLNDDESESECDEDDIQCQLQQQQQQGDEQEQYQPRQQGQQQRRRQQQGDEQEQYQPRQQGQQQRRRQQQRHQCQPQHQLLQELEQPNALLASRLYKQAKQENDDKNTVVSPAALQLALAAIQRGARGTTRRQLQRITCAGLSQQQSRHAHTALQQSLQGQGHIQRQNGQQQQSQVKTTTTIVINQRNRAQQQFIQAVQACLNAQVKQCNFQRQPQQCRQQINRYVAQMTNQKLRQVVPQDAITENTKMIVVNTAQVKALWGRQFRQQQQTRQAPFYPLGSQQPKRVQVMQTQGQFNYYEDEQLQIVGVPTQQQEMTLFVIVPKNKDGLNQVEKTQIQDGQQLKQLLEQAEQQQQQVDLQLPKFQIKHKLDAQQTLRKQGVQDVFDADEADLSGINGQQQQEQQQQRRRSRQQYGQSDEEEQYQQEGDEQRQHQLHVNKLIHQASIRVDEQGISAARQQGSQGQQYPEQDQEQDQDEYDEEDDQEQQYNYQQMQRQETFDEIFGQGQRQRSQRQRRNRRNQYQQYQQYQDQDEQGQYQYGEQRRVRANRAFAFALKHNPSNQIVMVGRVVDAAQKPKQHIQRQQGQQTLNGVDQQ